MDLDQEFTPFIDDLQPSGIIERNHTDSFLKRECQQVLLEMELGDKMDNAENPKLADSRENSLTSTGRTSPVRDTVDLQLTAGIGRKWGIAEDGSNILEEKAIRKNSFKFALHNAAEKGNVQKLEKLLKTGDPLEVDFKGKTVLHHACAFAYQKKALKMAEAILDSKLAQNTDMDDLRKKRLIDHQDNNGETGLHIAAKIGHVKLVEKLIFSAADVNLRDNNGTEPLELIYSKVPSVMTPVFDTAIECLVGDRLDQNLTVRFDFGSIIGYHNPVIDEDASFFEMETKLLSYCLQQSEQKRSAILLHPIVQVFLFFKWKKIRVLLWISILFHVIWLLLYTLFITDLYLMQCPYKISSNEELESHHDLNSSFPEYPATNGSEEIFMDENSTESNMNVTKSHTVSCEIGKDILSSVNIKLVVLFAVSISVAIKELYEIHSTPQIKFYFQQLENVGQWLLIGVVGLTSIPIFVRDDEREVIFIHSWQYQVAALGIFLAWSLILSQIGKIPRFGVYIEILGKVLRSFGMFMITFASLLVAFTVSFQILMPEKVEFQGFPWGFMKVLIMMIGEVNYDEIFYGEEAANEIPFPTSTKLLFGAFVSVVTIMLFNLLIGLTVSDIQGLETVAKLTSLSSQLDQIYLIEKFIISKKVQRRLKSINKHHWLKWFLVSQQSNDDLYMAYDTPITKIPRDLQHQIRELAIPNLKQEIDEDSGEEDDPQTQNSVQSGDTKISSTIGSTAELKEVIRDVLREFFDELRNSNQENQLQQAFATKAKVKSRNE